jgi:filamentous hemagglutinin family protein
MKTNTRGMNTNGANLGAVGGVMGRRLWNLAKSAGAAVGLAGWRGGRVTGAAVVAGLLAMASTTSVIAGPEGEQVVVGNVTFTRQGNLWIITASNGAIINYASFDILPYETVRFIQPHALASVLNRINSAAPTVIQGTLEANGNVFFVNPAGVIFGAGATVNVGGLYAAAGSMSNEDFLSGTMRFTNLKGSVVNEGNITANAVAMVGREVANHGSIVATGGTVVMAAGREVFIGREGSNVYTQIQSENDATAADRVGVTNTGTINARGGQVLMSAGDADGMAIFSSGVISGRTITIEGQGRGEVWVKGTVDATNSNGRGGDITITGEKVGLASATIDASGEYGGGTIKIGGDAGGLGDTRRADYVFMDADSTVRADAINQGDGGRITFWGTQATRVGGSISALGGTQGGNGGFVETSGGYIQIAATPTISARAAGGRGGLWIIDPNDITIVAGAGNTNINGADPFASTDDNAQLGVDLITAALGNGNSVSITTTNSGADSQAGVITLATNLSYTGTGTATLTLNAHSDIVFNAGVSVSGSAAGGLNLVLNADSDNNGSGNISLNTATITLNGGSLTASANAENFTLGVGGSITTGGGAMTLNNTGTNTIGGNLNLGAGAFTSATAGSTTFAGTVTAGSVSVAGSTAINGGTITTAGGTQTYTGAVTLGANTTLTGTTITFGSTLDSSGAARTLTVSGAGAFNGNVGSTLALSSLTVTGAATLTNANITTSTTQTYGGALTIGGSATTLTGTGISFQNTIDTSVDLTVASTGTVTFSGLATFGGDTVIGATGDITFTQAVRTDAGGDGLRSLTLNGSGVTSFFSSVSQAGRRFSTVTSNAAGSAILLGTVTATGNISLNDAAITFVSGATAVTSTGGDITIGGSLTLGADTVFTANNVTFSGTINDDAAATQRTLTVVSSGNTTFSASVGATRALASLITDAGGITFLGGNVTTAGAQTYGDAVELTGNAVITGANITFASTVDSSGAGRTLTVNDSGLTTFGGVVGGTLALTSLSTDAPGSTIFNGDVTTTGAITLLDAVRIGADMSFTGVDIRFGSTVDSDTTQRLLGIVDSGTTRFDAAVGSTLALSTLTVQGGGVARVSGNITTLGAQDWQNNVEVTADVTLLATAGTIDFNGTLDAVGAGVDLTVTSAGLGTTINGAVGGTTAFGSLTFGGAPVTIANNITTTGDQTYNDAVVIAAAGVTLTSTGSGAINFTNAVNGDIAGRSLTVNTGGITTFGGAVGGTQSLTNLTTDAAGSLVISAPITLANDGTFNDASISLGGNIFATNLTFGGATTLTGNVTLDVLNATFSSTLNADAEANNRQLTVTLAGGGVLTFTGAVGGTQRLDTITVNDGGAALTVLTSNVSTLGAQTYQTVVRLDGNVTLAGTNMTFGSAVDADAAANNRTLTINTTGGSTVTFSAAVGSTQALQSLTITDDAAGTTILTGNVTTTGAQTYNENVTLAADTTVLSSGGAAILFGGTVDSDATARALTTDTAGIVTFTGAVGATNALSTLSTLSGAAVINGGSVRTTTLQSYGGAVTLGGNTILTSDEIDFAGNVTGTGFTLGFQTFTAGTNIELAGAGGTGALDLTSAELAFLQDGFGSLNFGDAAMTGQIFVAGALSLIDAATFTVDGVNGGLIRILGNINSTDATNAATLAFNGPVQLDGDILITSAGTGANGDISFNGTVNADASANNRILTINSQGAVTFVGAVGGTQALGGLVTDAGGTTQITGNITTNAAGNMTFNDAVLLLGNSTLTGNNITFNGTLNADLASNNRDLIVTAGGIVTFAGVVGGTEALNDLTSNGAGTTAIRAAITTAGDQVYSNAVTLNSSLVTGGSITFNSTVDAAAAGDDLLLTTTNTTATQGNITFGGTVGGTTAFRDITTTAATNNATRLGANVTATRNIVLNGSTVVTNNITVTSERMSFLGTLDADAAGRTLSLASTATSGDSNNPLYRFGGSVGVSNSFQSITFADFTMTDPAFSTILFAPVAGAFSGGSAVQTIALNADTINFGRGNRVTAVSNFVINTTNLTVGDLSVAGNLSINATTITLLLRDGGRSETLPGGSDNGVDLGVDWVALGNIAANGTLQYDDGGVVSGSLPSGRVFTIATGNGGTVGGSAVTGIPASVLTINRGLAETLFGNGAAFRALDLTSGTSIDQPPIAGLNPRIEIGAVATPEPVSSELAEFMRLLDVSLKDEASIEDQLDSLIGRKLYVDMADPEYALAKDRYRVTRERLTAENVRPVRDSFRAVFQRQDGVNDAGEPVWVDDSKRVRDTLGKAWKAYRGQSERADGRGFRAFLEADQGNTDNAAAFEILQGLGVLFEQVDRLGFSDFEVQRPKNSILNRALPPEIGQNEAGRKILREAIEGEVLEVDPASMAMAGR